MIKMAFYLCDHAPIDLQLESNHEEKSSSILIVEPSTWPALQKKKTVKVKRNEECLRNRHSQEELPVADSTNVI